MRLAGVSIASAERGGKERGRHFVERQRHPFTPRLVRIVGGVETELSAHLQHGEVFRQHLPVHES